MKNREIFATSRELRSPRREFCAQNWESKKTSSTISKKFRQRGEIRQGIGNNWQPAKSNDDG